ncbi:hypothetical protein [Desulfoscipio gibsoniae]|uniref:Uncharacterized protein n=1 Tax=Desulfoscipio gibsoniae DSM 7213 TaxID=767817 RepID=R4KLK6_9FIRM|nr:hypothetical protein [Desulfoscipio gibsoniae]AGL02457.1 hypothetical protein Desgi_3087 [Desulfoscipio gibsoniae DSM 7213]
MDKKLCYIFSAVFIIAGSIIYTFERAISYFVWIGEMNAASITGSFPSQPELNPLFSNAFFLIFILLGLAFFVFGYKKN